MKKMFEDGEYEGEIIEGMRNGKGTMRFNNEDIYVGFFQDDKISGRGVFYFSYGTRYVRYEGDFEDGERVGYGVFYWIFPPRREIHEYQKNGEILRIATPRDSIMTIEENWQRMKVFTLEKVLSKDCYEKAEEYEKECLDYFRQYLFLRTRSSVVYSGSSADSFVQLERILSKEDDEFSNSEKEYFKLYKVFYFLRTKMSLDISSCFKNLMILEQLRLFEEKHPKISSKPFSNWFFDNICHYGYGCDGCKIKNWQGERWRCSECYNFDLCRGCMELKNHDPKHKFIKEGCESLRQTIITEEEMNRMKLDHVWSEVISGEIFFSKLMEYSWIGDDDYNRVDTLKQQITSTGWEEKDLEKMKNTVISILSQTCDNVVLSGLSQNSLTEEIVNKFNHLIHSKTDSDIQFVTEETKTIIEHEFQEKLKKHLPLLIRNFEKVKEEFFESFEIDRSYFSTSEEVILLDGREDDEDAKQLRLKYFGLNRKHHKSGYGLFYKQFTTGGFLNRKSMYRPVYYGRFLYSNTDHGEVGDRAVLVRHGDGCKEFSVKDGSLIFEGSFRNGLREGKGRETQSYKGENLVLFEGRYVNGLRHGRGEEFNPVTLVVRRGKWNHGVFDRSSVFQFDCPIVSYFEIQRHLNDSQVVGEGAFGVIYKVKSSAFSFLKKKRGKKVGSHVAVKIIKTKSRCENQMTERIIRRGIGLCNSISSKHLLESYGIVRGPNKVGYIY